MCLTCEPYRPGHEDTTSTDEQVCMLALSHLRLSCRPHRPECQRAGAVRCPERGERMDVRDLPPITDECDGLLDVWLSMHGRPA